MNGHPEYEGLLADVIARPDDDGPRLIMADWLEDHGQEARAGWIRLSMKPHGCRRPSSPQCRLWFDLWWGKGRLVFEGHETSRRTGAGVLIIVKERRHHETLQGVSVRRGFVETATMSLGQWLTVGRACVRRMPLTYVHCDGFRFGRPITGSAQAWPFRIFVNSSSDYRRASGVGTYLPSEFGPLLKGGRLLGVFYDREYERLDDAQVDLSQALIAWAKEVR